MINSFNKFIYPVLDPEKKRRFPLCKICESFSFAITSKRNRKKNKNLIYMFQCFVVENKQKLEGRKNIATYLAYERHGVQINRPIFLYKC